MKFRSPPSGNPDLIAGYDYIHFFEPALPPALIGLDLTDPAQVSNADLLGFLGNNADPQLSQCAADINNDGGVDGSDLVDLANEFGQTNCFAQDE